MLIKLLILVFLSLQPHTSHHQRSHQPRHRSTVSQRNNHLHNTIVEPSHPTPPSYGSLSPVIDLDPFNQHIGRSESIGNTIFSAESSFDSLSSNRRPASNTGRSRIAINVDDAEIEGLKRRNREEIFQSLRTDDNAEATVIEDFDYQDEQATQRSRGSVQHHLKERDGKWLVRLTGVTAQPGLRTTSP